MHVALLSFLLPIFASFPTSNTYQMYTYSLGANGGTNSSKSTTYSLNGSVGEQSNNSTHSTTETTGNGMIQAGQLNTPPAPTLSNGSNTYYNKLQFIINNSVDPSNATYSVAVSTNNFTTTSYVSANGTLGSTPVYQSYSAWGGSSGTYITGLATSTAYEVKADAQAGQFSDTNYGPYASASTVSPSITFSVSPNTVSMGNLVPGSVVSSSNITFGLSTNAGAGGAIYLSGLHGGLYSTSQNHTILAYTGNIASASEGFGVQAGNATQTSGGPFAISSPYNGTGNTVGLESSTPTQILYANNSITGGSATANLKAITSTITPTGGDYTETLTFISGANY